MGRMVLVMYTLCGVSALVSIAYLHLIVYCLWKEGLIFNGFTTYYYSNGWLDYFGVHGVGFRLHMA